MRRLLSAIAMTALLTTPASAYPTLGGVSALIGEGNSIGSGVLADTDIQCVSIRQDWSSLETSEGTFSWTYLDGKFTDAANNDKCVILRINTSYLNAPTWAKSGVATFSSESNGTGFIYWDTTLLARRQAMYEAVANRYGSNGYFTAIGAQFMNWSSEDWFVPHTSTDQDNWVTAGWDTTDLITFGEEWLDFMADTFPNQKILLPISNSGTIDTSDGMYLARTVAYFMLTNMVVAYGDRFAVMRNALARFTPDAEDSEGNPQWETMADFVGFPIGFQMLDDVSNDLDGPGSCYRMNDDTTCTTSSPNRPQDVFADAIAHGQTYAPFFYEIPKADLINSALDGLWESLP